MLLCESEATVLHGDRHLALILLVVGALVLGVFATPAGIAGAPDAGSTVSGAKPWPLPPVYYAGCDGLDNGEELPDC